ncbi:MAG: RNA-binding protein [Paludibacteraceae bacterium]|jgi:hypothetical protein|nr:RNA-binding protein [Paludibacteraceae bacterium]
MGAAGNKKPKKNNGKKTPTYEVEEAKNSSILSPQKKKK